MGPDTAVRQESSGGNAAAAAGYLSSPEARATGHNEEPVSAAVRWLKRLTKPRKVKSSDVVVLVRQLATLLGAGVPLSRSLTTVARQLEDLRLVAVAERLGERVRSGEMLSSAMAIEPGVFDSITLCIVKAGEIGGNLQETLDQLAEDLEKKDTLRRTVLGALAYPAIVIGIATIVVALLLIFVVPIFKDVYAKMHVRLPLVTQVLIFASGTALRFWWVPVIGTVGLPLAWKRLSKVEGFARKRDALMLRLPLFGKLRRKVIAARFLGSFGTMVASGVPIVESLRLLSVLTPNLVVREAIEDLRLQVSRGRSIGKQMERYSDLFTPMAVQMVSIGEETGSLPESVTRTAKFLNAEAETLVRSLTKLLEPTLTVGLGFVIGLIAIAIYLPMFDMVKMVSH